MADKLKLSAEPDGFGFFYGWVERDGEHVRVDVLPPQHLWRGDIKLEGHKPDPKAWVIYLDGEELARVERREDLAAVLLGIEGSIASGNNSANLSLRPRGLLAWARALWRGRSGSSLVEYSLLVGVAIAMVVVALVPLGRWLASVWTNLLGALSP
jgi:Flp pilus assembly pilin Flp